MRVLVQVPVLLVVVLAVVVVMGVATVAVAGPVALRSRGYEGVTVAIDDSVPPDNCRTVLNNLEASLDTASQFLHSALEGRAYLKSVTVLLPDSWDDSCSPRYVTPSSGEAPDVRVGVTHPVFGDSSWTQQSRGCGEPGDFIYTSYVNLLLGKNIGQTLAREWAKYRYGVFDETGFRSDPVYPSCYQNEQNTHVTACSDLPVDDTRLCSAPSLVVNYSSLVHPDASSSLLFARDSPHITRFCDETTHNKYAPTKHNLICDRKSAMEVIRRHSDFTESVGDFTVVKNTTPVVLYKRRKLTRYVLVAEDTAAMQLRESWGFLRTAVRKWLVYDLAPSTEVGLVLANETAAVRVHQIAALDNPATRDVLAATIPYAPGESHLPACLHCGVREALDMLKEVATTQGPASSVVILVAPGMDYVPELTSLLPRSISFGVKLATINYPVLVRQEPLDSLAEATGGVAFTVLEQRYNVATSYITTYFNLANVMFSIAEHFYEGRPNGMPVEIHRRELVDDGRSTFRGSFVLEDHLGEPAFFNVFTHNSPNPLIKSMSLTSPSQLKYFRRSDSMLTVKILTLPVNLNETGTWTYEVNRYPGNPQPHFIQVTASAKYKSAPVVRARAWTSKGKTPLILYTEVKRGDYPVLGARVEVVVSCPRKNSSTVHHDKFDLLDTGNGDPDITKGDGVYSKYFSAYSEGIHTFEISVIDNGNTAYSWQENTNALTYSECCGSSIPTPSAQSLPPFQRVLPPVSIAFGPRDTIPHSIVGRIGDLRAQVFAADLKARLTWTAPDVSTTSVARYEIRYTHRLDDIIEHYEALGQVWDYGSIFPLAPGSETTITLDFTRNPSLLDQPMYVRLRAFSETMDGFLEGPLSNWVYFVVPSPPPPPTVLPFNPFSTQDLKSRLKENVETASIIPGITNADFFSLEFLIPVVSGVALLAIIVVICCYLCVARKHRAAANEKQQAKVGECNGKPHIKSATATVTIIPSSPSNMSNINNIDSNTQLPDTIPPNYEDSIADGKRHDDDAVLGHEEDAVGEHHELLSHQKHKELAHHTTSTTMPSANSVGGISTISSNGSGTLVRGGRAVSPYQSWSVSQMLHQQERRHNSSSNAYANQPDDDRAPGGGGDPGQFSPTVPLHPTHQAYQLNPGTEYSPAPSYEMHTSAFPASIGYHRNGTLVHFNPALQGSLSSISSGDRKKRNITMV